MSSFYIPTNDPGSPRYQSFPDVIRGETIDGFLRRDRFVYATSRRLLFSVPNYSTTAAGAVIVYQGLSPLSPNITGKFWVVGYAEKGTVTIGLAGTTTQTYGTTAEGKSTLITTGLLPNAYAAFTVTVTKTVGQPYVNLYGLAVYEERLAEVDLP